MTIEAEDLTEKKEEEKKEKEEEIDPLKEIERNMTKDTLVLKL